MSVPTQASIEGVLRGILGAVDQQQAGAAVGLSDLPAFQKARMAAASGDFAGFKSSVLHPIGDAMDGLLAEAIPGNEKAQFLMREQAFVERSFRHIIVKVEGSSCCADKSRTIMGKLFHFLVHGECIAFDGNAKYTFHHPKIIFTTHTQIVEFFDALRDLYYARPERYILALASLFDQPQPRHGNDSATKTQPQEGND